MTETLLNIADAVVAELNTVVLPSSTLPGVSELPGAERLYLPRFELPEMVDLHVSVVPKSIDIGQAARTVTRSDHQIDIAVQQRTDPQDLNEVDPLLQLMGMIEAHFRGSGGRRLTSFPGAAWVGSRFEPIFAIEHLQTLRQFTSVLTLSFRCLTTGGTP